MIHFLVVNKGTKHNIMATGDGEEVGPEGEGGSEFPPPTGMSN